MGAGALRCLRTEPGPFVPAWGAPDPKYPAIRGLEEPIDTIMGQYCPNLYRERGEGRAAAKSVTASTASTPSSSPRPSPADSEPKSRASSVESLGPLVRGDRSIALLGPPAVSVLPRGR